MNNALIQKEDYSFEKFAAEVELMTKVCKQLLATKHYAGLGEGGIFAILQRAKALKIDPFDALNGGMYYVNGKVGMSTELMASLIRRQGHKIIKDPSSNDIVCTLQGKRADNGDEWISTFSMVDADRAGLKKNMFLKYPAIMLYNRAMSQLARQLFPDVIKGAGYEKDELEEIVANEPIKNWQPTIAKKLPIESSNESTLCHNSIVIELEVVTDEMASEFIEKLKLAEPDYREKLETFVLNNLGQTSIQCITIKDFKKLSDSLNKHLNTIGAIEDVGTGSTGTNTEISGSISD
jgi:hypothetical protein